MGSNAQKSGYPLVNMRLVSTADDAPQPYAITPAQQKEAIGILKDERDSDVFAWLRLARSLGRDTQDRSRHACLTHNQIRAIDALRHCEGNDISAWLHLARTSSMPREYCMILPT